jgi:hypothetical protein
VLLGPHRSEVKSAAPRYSPDLVQADEFVLRTILDPDHVDPSGNLSFAAIPLADIQYRGWSVDRKKYTSLRQLNLFHQDKKKRKTSIDRFYVLPVRVSEIRFNPDSGDQEFVVTDAALCNKPCHAVVLVSATGKQTPSKLKEFRSELLKRLPRYVKTVQIFEADDKYGYLRGMFRQLAVFSASLCHPRTWRFLFFSGRQTKEKGS